MDEILQDPSILINPSEKLLKYFNQMKKSPHTKQTPHKLLTTKTDLQYIQSLTTNNELNIKNNFKITDNNTSKNDLISLNDLHEIYKQILMNNEEKIYLHELLEGSEIVLPKNNKVIRNDELEVRCRKLQNEQDQKTYNKMTQCMSKENYVEDSFVRQLHEINTQILGVIQLIVTVATGFVFGFLGLQFMVGTMDIGVRLVSGFVCAGIVALAELYFFIKKIR